MNANIALRLALVASVTACVDLDADVLPVGATEQAIGSCTYRMAGAAITKQIVSIDEPTQILVELTTVTDKPYKLNATSMTFPAGFNSVSLATTTCSDSGASWKCRHQGVIQNTWATSGTGAYSMALTPVADPGSGCGNGASQHIDFWLTTESFATYGLDALGSEAILYPDWYYGGTAFGLQEGIYSFVGSNAYLNDMVSSIKVTPGWQVTLYEHANFTGNQVTLTADTPWLESFNDLASAAWVRRR